MDLCDMEIIISENNLKTHLKNFFTSLLFCGVMLFAGVVVANLSCKVYPYSASYPDPATAAMTCTNPPRSHIFERLSFLSNNTDVSYQFSLYCSNNPDTRNGYTDSYITCTVVGDSYYANGEFPDRDNNDDTDDTSVCTPGPIDIISGNKYKRHTDISSNSNLQQPLFSRLYNSQSNNRETVIGKNWLHSYQRSLKQFDIFKAATHSSGG